MFPHQVVFGVGQLLEADGIVAGWPRPRSLAMIDVRPTTGRLCCRP